MISDDIHKIRGLIKRDVLQIRKLLELKRSSARRRVDYINVRYQVAAFLGFSPNNCTTAEMLWKISGADRTTCCHLVGRNPDDLQLEVFILNHQHKFTRDAAKKQRRCEGDPLPHTRTDRG